MTTARFVTSKAELVIKATEAFNSGWLTECGNDLVFVPYNACGVLREEAVVPPGGPRQNAPKRTLRIEWLRFHGIEGSAPAG